MLRLPLSQKNLRGPAQAPPPEALTASAPAHGTHCPAPWPWGSLLACPLRALSWRSVTCSFAHLDLSSVGAEVLPLPLIPAPTAPWPLGLQQTLADVGHSPEWAGLLHPRPTQPRAPHAWLGSECPCGKLPPPVHLPVCGNPFCHSGSNNTGQTAGGCQVPGDVS